MPDRSRTPGVYQRSASLAGEAVLEHSARGFAAERGSRVGVDASVRHRRYGGASELYTPDAIAIAMEGWPETGPFEGREVVIRQYARLQENWDEQTNEAVRIFAQGDWEDAVEAAGW